MPKLTSEEALEVIREKATNGDIKFAPQDWVKVYEKEIQMVLDAVGHPEAWVSDESMLSDFGKPIGPIAEKLGIKISPSDYIWEIAARLSKGSGGN